MCLFSCSYKKRLAQVEALHSKHKHETDRRLIYLESQTAALEEKLRLLLNLPKLGWNSQGGKRKSKPTQEDMLREVQQVAELYNKGLSSVNIATKLNMKIADVYYRRNRAQALKLLK